MNAHISSLQEQVNALFASVTSFKSELSESGPPLDPSLPGGPYLHRADMSLGQQSHLLNPDQVQRRSPPTSRAPTFRGPISNAFSFDVAKSSLHTMGIAPEAPGDEGDTANGSPMASPRLPPIRYPNGSSQKDPIWFIAQAETMRLLDLYGGETHQMYPIVSLDKLKLHTQGLYKFLDAFRGSLLRNDSPGADAIYDDDTITLKLVLAIALTAEGKGRSETGHRLYETVQPQIHTLLLGEAGLREIRTLALTVSPASMIQKTRLTLDRQSMNSTLTTRAPHGGSLASQRGCVSNAVCTERRHTTG